MSVAHWKRHAIDGRFVYSLIIEARGERWCVKLIPSAASDGVLPSLARFWRDTVKVHEGTGFTKKTARAFLDSLIEVRAMERAEVSINGVLW